MSKEAKTAKELEAMIVARAADRADCAEVKTIAVRQGEVGWRVVTIVSDGRMMTVKAIDDIANELRAKYDLRSEA
jgi:hypothetical protein